MASLSNINGLFDVHSTGAILFSTSHGTSGQILRSNGNAAPTWVAASTVIGGPYLPLTGGTLSGPLSGTSLTLSGALSGTSATFNDFVEIRNDAAELYFENAANNRYWRWRRNTSDDFILDKYDGASTETLITCSYGSQDVGDFVCIGSQNPGTNINWGKLQVGGSITVGNSSGAYTAYGRIEANSSSGLKLRGSTTGSLGSPQGVTINGYNVGINTNSPNVGNAFGLVIRSWATLSRLVFWNSTSGEVSSRGQRISFSNANCIFENMESGYYAFKTGGSGANPSERMRIQSDGNVGIGTTSPGAKLQVQGNIGFGDADAGSYNGGSFVNSSSTGIDTNWGIEVQHTSGGVDYNTRLKYYPVSGQSRKAGIYNAQTNSFSLYSDTNNNPNIIIPDGNVGIGTAIPNNLLELSKSVSSGIGPILQLTNSQYTLANDSGSSIQFRGYTVWGPGSTNPRYSEINAINGG